MIILGILLLFSMGIILLIAGVFIVYNEVKKEEKKNWNGGICKETGLPWVRFWSNSDLPPRYTGGYTNNPHTDYQLILKYYNPEEDK